MLALYNKMVLGFPNMFLMLRGDSFLNKFDVLYDSVAAKD